MAHLTIHIYMVHPRIPDTAPLSQFVMHLFIKNLIGD